MRAPFRVIDCRRRANEHPGSVERRSVKVAKAVGLSQYSHQGLRRKERRRSREETTCLRSRKGQDVEGTEGALGEGERR